MNKKIIGLVAGIALSNLAIAADWRFVTVATKSFVYIDANSITNVNTYKKAWIKVEYGEEQTSPDTLKKYIQDKEQWYFDCKGRRIAIVSSTAYNAAGEVQQSDRLQFQPSNLHDVIPDTTGEGVFEFVCSDKSNRRSRPTKSSAKSSEL